MNSVVITGAVTEISSDKVFSERGAYVVEAATIDNGFEDRVTLRYAVEGVSPMDGLLRRAFRNQGLVRVTVTVEEL